MYSEVRGVPLLFPVSPFHLGQQQLYWADMHPVCTKWTRLESPVRLLTESVIHGSWKPNLGSSPEAYVFWAFWNTMPHLKKKKHYTAFLQWRFASWLPNCDHVTNSERLESWVSSTEHFVAITLAIIKLFVVNNASDSLQALPSPKYSIIVRQEVEVHWSASPVWIHWLSELSRQI